MAPPVRLIGAGVSLAAAGFSLFLDPAGPAAAQVEEFQRQPLKSTAPPLSSPTRWALRQRIDPVTGKEVDYDPKPRVVVVDAARGLYDLVWIGADNREKRIRYERPDANRAVVSATVGSPKPGMYLYTYSVANLKDSGQALGAFSVQAWADATPVDWSPPLARMRSGLLGPGHWWRFGFRLRDQDLAPGRTTVVRLMSSAAPGVVSCSVDGGWRAMKGVGEEMPAELEDVLPGYESWPRGITVGPDERLGILNGALRTARAIEWLPLFRDAGWITASRRGAYDQLLREKGLPALVAVVRQDVTQKRTAPEVGIVLERLVQ